MDRPTAASAGSRPRSTSTPTFAAALLGHVLDLISACIEHDLPAPRIRVANDDLHSLLAVDLAPAQVTYDDGLLRHAVYPSASTVAMRKRIHEIASDDRRASVIPRPAIDRERSAERGVDD